jgi:membrane fusion protein, heavy metal efflux system
MLEGQRVSKNWRVIPVPVANRMIRHPLSALLFVAPVVTFGCLTPGVQAQAVEITDQQMRQLAISTAGLKPTTSEPVAVLPATVVPPWNSHIVAAAPFAGTVTEMLILPGQSVDKGSPVAKITSRELLETESQLAQAEAELQMADAIARRKRTLANKKLQSPVVAEEAEAQVAKIQAVIDQIKRTKSLSEITNLGGGLYTLPAPASGIIVETHVMPGKMIEALSPIISVETSEKLWLDIQVPASLIAKISVGDPVQVTDGPTARIISISTVIDPKTRSASVIAELAPGSGLLHGQMISVTLMRASSADVFQVPASAVTRVNDRSSVFVKTNLGFELKSVEVRGKSVDSATVSGDFSPGVQVATSGLPQLEQMMAAE